MSKQVVRFVTEEPAEKDEFGAHGRVANALCSVLLDSQNTKSIGILGDWGSGKSTVIDLAARSLKSRDQVRQFEFFVYDAWLHQNDPTRRSLLEELIAFLTDLGIPDAKKICDLEKLTGEESEQENTNKPLLNPLSVIFAFALTLVPAGLVLMRSTDTVTIVGQTIFAVRTLGHIMLFAPALIFGAIFAVSRPHMKVWEASFWTKARESQSITGLASLLINKSPDKVVVTTKRRPEPTASEFHAGFKKLIAAASKKKINVVIVIDNLDRVDAEHAMSMWSIMRSFFDHIESIDPDEINYRSRLVLPFDNKSLLTLYAKDGDVESSAAGRAQAFIEKTFDVVFQVGPPISSDWEAYLGSKLIYAFGDLATTDRRFAAYRIYSDIFDPLGIGLNVTPRRINAYVNRIVALWLQWGEAVNFSSLAYYAAVSLPGTFEIRSVLSPDSPASPLMNDLHSDWRRDIAVLHYGVTEDKAFQVLVGPEIDTCFKGATTGASFGELVRIPGFETALRSFLEAKLSMEQAPPDPAYVLNAAQNVAAHLEGALGIKGIWRPILASLNRLAPWSEKPTSPDGGMNGLLAHDRNAQLSLARSLQSVEEGSPISAPRAWLEQAGAITAAGDDARVWQALVVPGSATQYLDTLAVHDTRTPLRDRSKFWRSLKPAADRAAIEGQLLENIDHPSLSSVALSQIRSLAKVDVDWRWGDAVKALNTRLRAATDIITAVGFAQGLLALYRAADPTLVKLREEGYTADLFAKSVSERNHHAIAVSLAMLTEMDGNIGHVTEFGQSALGQSQIDALDDTIRPMFNEVVEDYLRLCTQNTAQSEYLEAELFPFLARASKRNEKWRAFSSAVMSRMVKGAGTWERGHPKAIFTEADSYLDLLPPDIFAQLMGATATFQGFSESVASVPNEAFWAIAHESSNSEELQSWINEQSKTRLSQLSHENWNQMFTGNIRLVGRIVRTKAKVSQADFGDKFSSNAETWWSRFMDSGDRRLRAESVVGLLRRLKKSKREVMLKTALEKLLDDRPDAWDKTFVERLIPALAEFGFVSEEIDRLARSLVLAPLSSGSSEVQLSILGLHRPLAKLVRAADESTQEEIMDQLARLEAEDIQVASLASSARTTWREQVQVPAG